MLAGAGRKERVAASSLVRSLTVKLLTLRQKVPGERIVLLHDVGIVSLGQGASPVGNGVFLVEAPLLTLEVPHLDLKPGNMVPGGWEGGECGRKVVEIEDAEGRHCDRCLVEYGDKYSWTLGDVLAIENESAACWWKRDGSR